MSIFFQKHELDIPSQFEWLAGQRKWTITSGWNAREGFRVYMRMAHHGKRLVIQSLRATYVLAFLFAFSLFYFVVESGLLAWLIQNALNISGQDIEEQMLDKYKLTAHRHIQWLADSSGRNINAVNDSLVKDEGTACRNTVQGRTSVTDDRGYTCERAFLMSNGCCEVGTQSVRFSCAWCDLYAGCCSHYEQCVSCCLRPEQKNILLEMIESTSGHRLRQILSATDQFELCMLKCRTSSNSVHSENKYKSEKMKYCYKQEPSRPFSR